MTVNNVENTFTDTLKRIAINSARYVALKGSNMDIKDIRLTPAEQCAAWHNKKTTPERYLRAWHDSEFVIPTTRLANAATDKAIKKIVEALQPDKRFNFNATCYDCMAGLNKLIGGG